MAGDPIGSGFVTLLDLIERHPLAGGATTSSCVVWRYIEDCHLDVCQGSANSDDDKRMMRTGKMNPKSLHRQTEYTLVSGPRVQVMCLFIELRQKQTLDLHHSLPRLRYSTFTLPSPCLPSPCPDHTSLVREFESRYPRLRRLDFAS